MIIYKFFCDYTKQLGLSILVLVTAAAIAGKETFLAAVLPGKKLERRPAHNVLPFGPSDKRVAGENAREFKTKVTSILNKALTATAPRSTTKNRLKYYCKLHSAFKPRNLYQDAYGRVDCDD